MSRFIRLSAITENEGKLYKNPLAIDPSTVVTFEPCSIALPEGGTKHAVAIVASKDCAQLIFKVAETMDVVETLINKAMALRCPNCDADYKTVATLHKED